MAKWRAHIAAAPFPIRVQRRVGAGVQSRHAARRAARVIVEAEARERRGVAHRCVGSQWRPCARAGRRRLDAKGIVLGEGVPASRDPIAASARQPAKQRPIHTASARCQLTHPTGCRSVSALPLGSRAQTSRCPTPGPSRKSCSTFESPRCVGALHACSPPPPPPPLRVKLSCSEAAPERITGPRAGHAAE